ncbi:MAG TPA: carboxymuconolactone decarboxylase family protein [Sphingomicrobium sp.]|nr:carboxymuconolactone decarboxylase family protein [Sphingomicrobium sp.]
MSERYLRGIEIAEQLASEKLEEFTTSRVAELAPDFARMAIEFPLGDLYARPGLDLRSREIVAIASLASLGSAEPQLRNHIRAAMQIGLTRAEIIEILMQSAIYAGFPAALNALTRCHDLLTEESPPQASIGVEPHCWDGRK